MGRDSVMPDGPNFRATRNSTVIRGRPSQHVSFGGGVSVRTHEARGRRISSVPDGKVDEESDDENRRFYWVRAKSRQLSDNWRFAMLTTALTIYALFGDDFRLAITHRDMDVLFNVITIFCILVFVAEIVISSMGVDEYFLGFFCCLDIASTSTLILDLTWIGNAIFCADSDGDGALRTGRAGKAGARASRTVRIIRLMRLVKLYKAYKTNLEMKKEKQVRKASLFEGGGRDSHGGGAVGPGEGEEDVLSQEDEAADDYAGGRATEVSYQGSLVESREERQQRKNPGSAPETRVGKKLSDMTTRRVIILVLVMLFCMPQFTPSTNTFLGTDEFLSSAAYGADVIYGRMRRFCLEGASTNGSLPWCLQDLDPPADGHLERRQLNRAWFEKAFLNFVYQHHAGDFSWKLFWVGVNSPVLVQDPGGPAAAMSLEEKEDQAKDYLGELLRLNQERYLGAHTYPISDWDARFLNPGWDLNVVPLGEAVKERLTQRWEERCGSFVGHPVQPAVQAPTRTGCSTSAELRCSERNFAVPFGLSDREQFNFGMLFTFDIRGTTRLEAGLSMLQTIFICFAVGIGAMSFSKDANELLLYPIERMIAKMETIKDNPLEAMRLGDLEYRREEVEQARRKEELAQMGRCWKLVYRYKYMKKTKEPMETVMLEKTIIKLGGLLALGFGEAGAEIIGRNMQGSQTASVNAAIPGQKVDCILGFAKIHHFAFATEVLKEKVMLFVNQVSEIVHGCVDDYHGAPTKNVGDSFMLVWRLSGLPPDRQTKLADMAIMSFVKIVGEVNKSRVLAVYRKHPGFLQRVKGYRVEMGFGLHSGWAIEGAIGSEYKIDASYLSPSVHVTARMQAATTAYGVWMLISHYMVHLCSQDLALLCRLVDHVTIKGSRHPIRVYTLDLDSQALEVVFKAPEPVTRNRFKIRQLREVRKNEKFQEDYNVSDLFSYDDDIIKMREKYSKEFFHRFSMAYRNYEAGEWLAARDMLFTCHYFPKADVGRYMVTSEAEWPTDGPTVMLLLFMKQFNFEPPPEWPGHRELPER